MNNIKQLINRYKLVVKNSKVRSILKRLKLNRVKRTEDGPCEVVVYEAGPDLDVLVSFIIILYNAQ